MVFHNQPTYSLTLWRKKQQQHNKDVLSVTLSNLPGHFMWPCSVARGTYAYANPEHASWHTLFASMLSTTLQMWSLWMFFINVSLKPSSEPEGRCSKIFSGRENTACTKWYYPWGTKRGKNKLPIWEDDQEDPAHRCVDSGENDLATGCSDVT